MKRIPAEKQRVLFTAFERGRTIRAASASARVAQNTTWKYFKSFAAAGFTRGDLRRPGRRGVDSAPVYCGPVWIG